MYDFLLISGTYSSEYPSSPRDSYNNGGKMRDGGGNRFSLGMGNYNNLDSCPMGDSVGVYSPTSTNNSSSQQYDSVNHPPIRETGIIEKLLVWFICYFKIRI